MMIDRILEAIAKDGRASDWKVAERSKEGLERYFVRGEPDCSRRVDTTLYDVVVWVDSGKDASRTRGECSILVHPGSSDEELRSSIGRALGTAGGIANPWFPLPEPSDRKLGVEPCAFSGMAMPAAMERLRAALYRHDGLDGATINSLELFLSRTRTRLVTSRGVDVSWDSWWGFCEFVVNAGVRGKDEIELYAETLFSDLDEERLAAAARRQLEAARDRLAAIPTPALDGLPLILSGEDAGELYSYWFQNTQAVAVYEKRAAFGLGDDVAAGADATAGGDPINLRAVPTVKGSPQGSPYDAMGFALGPAPLIRNGKVVGLVASSKYAHYLGLEPTGAMSQFEMGPGALPEAALRSGDHIEVRSFSDFHVDGTTGDFGGEIRLGYVQRGGERVPVRGGSVTGSLVDNKGRVRLSRELEVTKLGLGPSCCLIPAVSVAAGE